MCADFLNPTGIHDDDLVRRQNGGKAVGDGDDGFPSGETVQRHLNLFLRLGIECRSRFIEEKYRRIL